MDIRQKVSSTDIFVFLRHFVYFLSTYFFVKMNNETFIVVFFSQIPLKSAYVLWYRKHWSCITESYKSVSQYHFRYRQISNHCLVQLKLNPILAKVMIYVLHPSYTQPIPILHPIQAHTCPPTKAVCRASSCLLEITTRCWRVLCNLDPNNTLDDKQTISWSILFFLVEASSEPSRIRWPDRGPWPADYDRYYLESRL